jgi:hypothetical protein
VLASKERVVTGWMMFSIIAGVASAFAAGYAIAKKEAGWAAFYSVCAVVNILIPVVQLAVQIGKLS